MMLRREAIPLLPAGPWSSKRRTWKGGKEWMAVMKAFAIAALPFIIAEALTGIASLVNNELRIPPTVGIGTAADCLILLAGLVVAIARLPRQGNQSEESVA